MLRPCSHAAALAILSLLATLDMLFQPASRSGAIAAKDAELKFDAYGGIAALPCPGGKKPRFYTEKFDKWWHLCTPAGNAFWMNAVYNLSEAGDNGADHQGVRLHDLLVSKYGNGFTSNATLNIALQQMRRLQSWGFNVKRQGPPAVSQQQGLQH